MKQIFTVGKRFVDETGCERIFHGINLVYKGDHTDPANPRFIPEDWDRSLVERLRDLGVNAVRLGLVWEAVEPQPGVYDDEYLAFYSDFADLLAEYEIYFYLDMHQDLYGAMGTVWGGDGAPDWAYHSDGKTPRKPAFVWAEGYFFPGSCTRAFDHFWRNDPAEGIGLKDRFAALWAHVATVFKEKPNLLGFDVFNEPFPGSPGPKVIARLVAGVVREILTNQNIDKKAVLRRFAETKDPMAFVDAASDTETYGRIILRCKEQIRRFDLTHYYPFLRQVASAIRGVTDRGIIFAENSYFSNLGIPYSVPNLTYRNGVREEKFAFAPHGYDLTVDTPMMENAPLSRVEYVFSEHARSQERLGVPVLVGEWGGFTTDTPGSRRQMEFLLDTFDRNKWSHTFWAYFGGIDEHGVYKLLARPYPTSVAGEIESYRFDAEKNEFTLRFHAKKGAKYGARIYLPSAPVSVEAPGAHRYEGHILTVAAVRGENLVRVCL